MANTLDSTETTLRELAEQASLRAALVRDISLALVSAGTAREMLQRCCAALVLHLDAAFARVWTLNDAERVLELQASAGMYTHIDGPHGRVPVGAFKIGLIAEERAPHLTNQVVGDPRVGDQEWAKREGMVAFAGYPLLVEDRLVGVMALFARHALSVATLDALSSVALLIGTGIERKRAEEALRDSQAAHGAILEAALDCIITMDAQGRIVDFNPAAEATFGYSRARAVGRALADLIIPPAYREAHWRGLERYHATGQGPVLGRRLELSAMRADGSEFPVELAIVPMPAGGRAAFTGYLRDISGRKQTEEARLRLLARERRRAEQLQALARAALAVSAPLSREGLLQVITDNAREILGAHRAETRLAADERASGEVPSRGRLAVPLLARDGSSLGVIELSDKREGEFSAEDEAILVQLAQLASLALENSRLLEEAQEGIRARDDFLAAASHDLKNPLATIQGTAQLLQRTLTRTGTIPPERLGPAMEGLATAAARMTAQINELLDVARLRLGQPLALERRPVDLVELARRAVGAAAQTTERHRILLRQGSEEAGTGGDRESGEDAAPIVGEWDAARLARVLDNLLSNAIKYSPEGGEVVVGVSRDGDEAVLWVRDEGIGIPTEDVPRIFERFARAANVAGRFGGTGIGLSTAAQIVRGHGGTIRAESEPGKGSTFIVRLPLRRTTEQHPRPDPSERQTI